MAAVELELQRPAQPGRDIERRRALHRCHFDAERFQALALGGDLGLVNQRLTSGGQGEHFIGEPPGRPPLPKLAQAQPDGLRMDLQADPGRRGRRGGLACSPRSILGSRDLVKLFPEHEQLTAFVEKPVAQRVLNNRRLAH